MRSIWTVCAVTLLSSGCLVDQRSIAPLFEEGEHVALPDLVGTWQRTTSGEPTRLTFALGEGRTYTLVVAEDGTSTRPMPVALGRIGDELYWDLIASPDALGGDGGTEAQLLVPLHGIARVRLENGRLEIAPVRSDWLEAALEERAVEAPCVVVEDTPILSGSTAELQQLIRDHAQEPGFLDEDPYVFSRD